MKSMMKKIKMEVNSYGELVIKGLPAEVLSVWSRKKSAYVYVSSYIYSFLISIKALEKTGETYAIEDEGEDGEEYEEEYISKVMKKDGESSKNEDMYN